MNDAVNETVCWQQRFEEYRSYLLHIAAAKISPVLQRRITAEDLVQETLMNAGRRCAFFEKRPEIPMERKLRIILEQTLCAMERRHLQSNKRDAYREVAVMDESATHPNGLMNWNMFADSSPGPHTHTVWRERMLLIHHLISKMPEKDRCVLELRILQSKSNQECASILGVTEKNASIRFVRAVQLLQAELSLYTRIS